MINNNNLASSPYIRPVQMLEPQHVAIQIEPDIEAPQKNAPPHLNQALQHQKRPALATQLAEKLKNGTAQLANSVMGAVTTVKDNPKAAVGVATAGALTLLGTAALAHSDGSSAHLHHVMRQIGGTGGFKPQPDSNTDDNSGSGIHDAATGIVITLAAAAAIVGGGYAINRFCKKD